MTRMLPLFPLGSVLYPGLLLPMHIFEDRYRKLVHDLLAEPEPRRFGVIAIREGRETGADGVSALYDIGCTATVRQVIEQEDGRFYLITVGTQRFRLGEIDRSEPYLRGQVDYLPEEPVQLSYLVAASMIANLGDKQALLAQPDALQRLTTERALLSRENAMLRSLTSAPAPEFRHVPYSPN